MKYTIPFSATILLCLVFLAGCQSPQDIRTINVNGHADMTVAPDTARVYAGISILKPTAQEAQAESNKVVNAIIDGLRYEGMSKDDIETESLQLYEEKQWVYEKYEDTPGVIRYPDGKEVSMGWRATQTLKIKTSDLELVGPIVDIAVQNGANQINSIEFYLSSSKEDESRAEVLQMASLSAKKKANIMASSLDAKIIGIKSASESNYGYMPYSYSMKNNVGVAAVQESATVMPKDVALSADIVVVYEIR